MGNRAGIVYPILAALLASSCNEPTPRLLGNRSASLHGAFTTTDCALSVIYDAMSVEWNNGAPDPRRMPGANFAIVANASARGQAITLDLRGHVTPTGAGTVQLQIGNRRVDLRPTAEEYSLSTDAVLSGDSDTTPVMVRLNLPEPEDESAAMLTLDSIDVSLPECTNSGHGAKQ